MLMNEHLREAVLAHTVLITTLDSLTDPTQRDTALRLVREWYDRNLNASIEEQTIRGAQAKILGECFTLPMFTPAKKPADRAMFETLSKAWLTWAAGTNPEELLVSVAKPAEFGGAIHLMALEPWGFGIRALAKKDVEEARRFFHRSIELGTQYATETNDVVKWTYAASFFHLGTKTFGV